MLKHIFILVLIISNSAFGQSDEVNHELERKIERQLTERIGEFLENRRFFVEVEAELVNVEKVKSIPFIPNRLAIASSNLTVIKEYIKKINIHILIDELIDKKTYILLHQVTKRELRLPKDKLFIKVKKQIFPSLSLENRLREDKRDLLGQVDSLEKKTMSLTDENNKLATDLKEASKQIDQLKEKLSSFTMGKYLKNNLLWIVSLAIGSLCFLVFLVLQQKSVKNATSALAAPFSQIAQAITNASERALESPMLEGEKVSEISTYSSSQARGDVVSANSYSRLENLTRELAEVLAETDLTDLTYFFNEQLGFDSTVARSVYLMEVIPKEISRTIFESLGNKQKENVIKILHANSQPANKIELSIEAAEALKTRLLKGSLGEIDELLNPSIISKLSQVPENQLQDIYNELSTDTRMRFLLYLNPTQLSDLIKSASHGSEADSDALIDSLANISDFDSRYDLDADLEGKINETIKKNESDKDKKFLPLFKDLLRSCPDDIGQKLLDTLAVHKQNLHAALRNEVFTLVDFFNLKPIWQNSILDNLNNRQIALVLTILSDEQARLLSSLLDEKQKEVIADEKERFSEANPILMRPQVDQAKQKLIKEIYNLSQKVENRGDLFEKNAVQGSADNDPSFVDKGAA